MKKAGVTKSSRDSTHGNYHAQVTTSGLMHLLISWNIAIHMWCSIHISCMEVVVKQSSSSRITVSLIAYLQATASLICTCKMFLKESGKDSNSATYVAGLVASISYTLQPDQLDGPVIWQRVSSNGSSKARLKTGQQVLAAYSGHFG